MTLKLTGQPSSSFDLTDPIIYFGTSLEVNLVPLPSGAWMGLALLGGIGIFHVVRRRRASAI